MLKNIFNYYFKPINVEVKYSTGTKFKITITSDADLRIKIPRDTDSNIEREWVNRCKTIAKYFQLHGYKYTVRSDTRGHLSDIYLRRDNRQAIFKVSKLIVYKLKEKEQC